MKHTYHALLDVKSVSRDICVNDELILSILTNAANSIRATILSTHRYRFGYDSPDGCAVVLMLDESHITAHTYADNGKISIDVFTCNGRRNCELATKLIIDELSVTEYELNIVERFI